jgi:hypothetical protein
MEYQVAYDVVTEGLRGALPTDYYIAWAVTVVGGICAIYYGIRRRQVRPVLVGLFFGGFFTYWAVVGYRRQASLIASARTGDYQVAEGVVTNFRPRPKSGKGFEEFTVNQLRFAYLDGTQGVGFSQDVTAGGPIREGLQVRVSHRDGRILKLEIRR